MSSSAADICTLVWPIAYEEENTFLLHNHQQQHQLTRVNGESNALGNAVCSQLVKLHVNNNNNTKELAGRWIVGWNPRGLSVIVAWFFACETYHEAAEQLEIVKRILSHHHHEHKQHNAKRHLHSSKGNSNNNSSTECNEEYDEEEHELSPFIGNLLHYSHEWKHKLSELKGNEHYFCEEEEEQQEYQKEELEEEEEEEENESLESQSYEHQLHHQYTNRRRSTHSGTPHYSDLQILGYLRNIPTHATSSVREAGACGLPFSPYSPRRTFPTFPLGSSSNSNNHNYYEDTSANPCSPASPGPMVLRENTVRLMRQQNDIWLELQHGPVLGEVWCCGCRVQPCQLHVIRVDARKISSTRPHLWSATSLYGSSALVNLLMRGEKPICVLGAHSIVEGVLLPKVMIGESSPATHHTLSETDYHDNYQNNNKSNNKNNQISSKSKNANGSNSDVIFTTTTTTTTTTNNNNNNNIRKNNKDHISRFSKNRTYTINDGSVISHDNSNNSIKSNSLSNNTSYIAMDNTMPNTHHGHHINSEHETIKSISFHPYDVSVQSSSETMTSTPATTTTTTFITQVYKNNSQATTKPTDAASLSTSTPTLLCDSTQPFHSITQAQKALPTSEQTRSKRKTKEHTSKEHATQANGVKVELHVATHSQNRSSCESIGLTQLPDSHEEQHEQELQEEEQEMSSATAALSASAKADVSCKHTNQLPSKRSHQLESNKTIPPCSIINLTTTVECKQSEVGTENNEYVCDKMEITESDNNTNNDETNIKNNDNDDDDGEMINSSFETTIKAGSSISSKSELLESTFASNHLEQNSGLELLAPVNDINSKNSVHSYSRNEHLLANGECNIKHYDEVTNNSKKTHRFRKDSEVSWKEMSDSAINSTTRDLSAADTSASTTDKCESEFVREERANENESSNIFTERDANSLPSVVSSDATTRHACEVQKKPEPGVAPRLDFPLSIDEAEMSTMIAVSRAGCNVREVIEILESIAEGKEGNEVTPLQKMNGTTSKCCGHANGVTTQQQQESNNTQPSLTEFLNKNNNNNNIKNKTENNSGSRNRRRRRGNKVNIEKNSNENDNSKKVTYHEVNTNKSKTEIEEQEDKSITANTIRSDQVTPTKTLSAVDEWILWLVGITTTVLSKIVLVLSTLSRYSYTMAIAEIRLRALINFLSLLTHKTRSCGLHPVLPHLLTGHTVRRTSVWCVGNFLIQLMVDCVLGTLLCLLLATGGPPLHGWAVRVSRYFLYETHMSYLDWFDGWPAGLKVNGDLNITLCFFAKLIMNLWDWMMRVSPGHVWQWWTSTPNSTHLSEDEFCHRQWPQWQWSYTKYNNLFVNTNIATQYNMNNNNNTYATTNSGGNTYINCTNSDVDLYSFHYNYRWIPPCYYSLVLISITGASSAFAFVADLSRFVSLQLQLLYHSMALLMRLAVTIVSNLYRQFRGQRYNPLRQRVDAYDFDLDQMLLATFLFTVAVFLFPTLMVYYVYFAFVRVTIWYMQRMLSTIAFMILYVPLFPIVYWHLYRHKWRGGVVLGSPRISRVKSNVLSGNVREGVSFTVDVSVHVMPLLFSHVISDFAVVFRLLVKELSLSKMSDILLHATVPRETNLVSKLIPHLRANAIDPPCTLCV